MSTAPVHALEISGTFTLDSSVSISQTTTIKVEAFNPVVGFKSTQVVTLNPGDNSSNFTFPFSFPSLPDPGVSGHWVLLYKCDKTLTPAGCDDIVADGSYSTDISAVNNTVYDYNLVTQLPDTVDSTGLMFAVYPGKSLTGTIATVSGANVTQDTIVDIVAVAKTPTGVIITNFKSQPVIANGGSQAIYKITLPDNDAETFEVRYTCFPIHPECEPYVTTGYFDDSANGNTSASLVDADTFNDTSNYSNISMRLIPAETLSGTITLDNAAPVGGLEIRVIALNLTTTSTIQVNVDFAFGDTSSNYSVPIPDDAVQWQLRYVCVTDGACDDYVNNSYYNSSAVNDLVYSTAEAEALNGGVSIANLDVFFAASPRISGKLFLSQGVAPVGGLEFLMSARDPVTNIRVDRFYTLLEGESELDYQMVVDPDVNRNWLVIYECREANTVLCSEVTDMGYYDSNTGNTITDVNAAATLVGGVSHDDIDIRVLSTFPDLSTLCVPVVTNNGVVVFCL